MEDIIIKDVTKISLRADEVLLVRIPRDVPQSTMHKFFNMLTGALNSQNVIVYSCDNIDFLKVALEEKLIDKLIEDEIQK